MQAMQHAYNEGLQSNSVFRAKYRASSSCRCLGSSTPEKHLAWWHEVIEVHDVDNMQSRLDPIPGFESQVVEASAQATTFKSFLLPVGIQSITNSAKLFGGRKANQDFTRAQAAS